jgi:hypothetical protein
MKSSLLTYSAIAVLSFTCTLFGYLAFSDNPKIGASLGFMVGSFSGVLLSRFLAISEKNHEDLNQTMNNIKTSNISVNLNRLYQHIENLTKAKTHQISTTKNQSIEVSWNGYCSEQDATQIKQWLASKDSKLIQSHSKKKVDKTLDKIAWLIGDNYPLVSDLMQRIRHSLSSDKTNFSLDLSGATTDKISVLTNICSHLKNLGLIQYHYHDDKGSSKKIAYISPFQSNGNQFLTGQWLERYAYQTVTNFLDAKGVAYEALMNAKILKSNKQKIEIDILLIIQNSPLWLECKVANHERFISKYSAFAKQFKLRPEQMYLIVLDLPTQQAEDLTSLHNIKVVTSDKITDALQATLAFIQSQA